MSLIAQNPAAQKANGNVVAEAFVKGEVYYRADSAIHEAPAGGYAIEHRDGYVRFFGPAGEETFAIALDSFAQHLQEGRIALIARRRAA